VTKRRAVKRHSTGEGISLKGVLFTSALIVVTAFVSLGVAIHVIAVSRERPNRPDCTSNIKQILYACALYSGDNAKAFPPDLGALVPAYVSDVKLFICPRSGAPVKLGIAGPITDKNLTYCYVSGLTATDPPHYVLIFDEEWNHKKQDANVAFVGGEVTRWRRMAALHDQLAKQEAELAAKGRTIEIIRPSWSTWPDRPPWVEPRPRSWWLVGGTAVGAGVVLVAGFLLLARWKRRRA